MGQSDLEVLLDMGFDKARAELAVKKTGGCQFLCIAFPTTGKANAENSAGGLELVIIKTFPSRLMSWHH
jgi:hypothetical protein